MTLKPLGLPEASAIPNLTESSRYPSILVPVPNDAANQSQQLTIYALLRMAETGNLPDAVRLDYLIRTPSGSSKHVRLQSTRTRADLQAMIRRINTATALVQKGVFPPTNPTDWMCSPRYCEYFIDCQYTRGRVS